MDNSDYLHKSSDLIFTSGSTDNATRCVDISILDDGALEGNQTFTVTLTTSDPDVMLGTNVTTITITDNDGQYSDSNATASLSYFSLMQM